MAVNHNPIEQIGEEHVGKVVSYQCAGMKDPAYGIITGISIFPDQAFVKYDGDTDGKLTDLYNMRWGKCPAWLEDRDGRWFANGS